MPFKPSCFVIMPFGKKKDQEGNLFDFDFIYQNLMAPAIEDAGMTAIRADEETVNGIIHKPMYERLILSDYAVADLTTANANVFYELGIRHAVKPFTTITLFAAGVSLPFDLNFLRCLPYNYHKEALLTQKEKDVKALSLQLLQAKHDATTDSPVYQLIDGIHFQNSVAHEKTDIFRDKVAYDEQVKKSLLQIRSTKADNSEKVKMLDAFVQSIGPLENNEIGVLVDIMLCYRSFEAFEKMISFIQQLPIHVQQTVMVQEQQAFALNRLGTDAAREEAIQILNQLLLSNGGSSETYGILGRIYKDQFMAALKNNNNLLAEAYLDKALETYLAGFRFDWRDAYPGINAVTLMDLKGDTEGVSKLAPVVEFAVLRKMERKTPDYWDYASLLELAVIQDDATAIRNYLLKAIALNTDPWMKKTTVNNLALIKSYRDKRNKTTDQVEMVIQALQ